MLVFTFNIYTLSADQSHRVHLAKMCLYFVTFWIRGLIFEYDSLSFVRIIWVVFKKYIILDFFIVAVNE